MKVLILLISLLSFWSSLAKEGKEDWGLTLETGTSTIRIGGRLQGIAGFNLSEGKQDLYLRRARVNLQYETKDDHIISLDLRNDNSNKDDGGEGKLLFGDAYYEMPIRNLGILKDLTLFRAKVDVSFSQTASSKNLIHPNRESSSEYASNFIVHNRRANNIQVNGENNWMTFQLAIADGVQSDALTSAFGNVSINSITKQSLTFGGKARFYLWNPENKKAPIQETFYKKMRTLSFGLGYFYNPQITYLLSNGSKISDSRALYNFDFSFAFDNLRLVGEYFIFEGDTINLAQSKIGQSHGGYMRGEYLFGKIAPYFGLNIFKRDKDFDQSFEKSQLIGINYYENGVNSRYGISYKNYDYDNALASRDKRELMTYVMLHY